MPESTLPPIVSSGTSLQEAISLMNRADTDYLLVVNDGQLVGWLTAKDVVKLVALGNIYEDCTLEVVMTQPHHVLNLEEAEDLLLVWQYFQQYQVLQLPVVGDKGEFLGLVTAQEVIKGQTKYVEALKQQFNHSSLAETASSYLLKEITNFYPGIIYIYDLDRQFIVYNGESMEGFLGYTKEEIGRRGGEILLATIHPHDISLFNSLMAEARLLADGELKEFEYRAYSVYGNVRWLQNDLRVFRRKTNGEAKLLVGFIQDISDRKQTELALQSSEYFLQRITETIPGIVYIFDLQKQCNVYLSVTSTDILGYPKEAIAEMGNNFISQIIHPEDLINVFPMITKQLATQSVAQAEYRVKNAQGEWRWGLDQMVVFQRNEAGLPQQILGIVIDINDRKVAEAELQNMEQLLRQSNAELEIKIIERTKDLWEANVKLAHQIDEKTKLAAALNQSENLFRSIFEQAAVGIRITDEEGRLIRVNQKLCQIMGYTEDELLTMTYVELIHPEFLNSTFVLEERIKKLGKNRSIEKQNIRKDGSLIWVNVTSSQVEGIIGRGVCTMAIVEDISDRKQVEVALRKSEDKFQNMVANIPGMVYQFRRDIAGDFHMDYASSFCQQLYEVPAIEVMRNVNIIVDTIHPEQVEKFYDSINQSLETMQPWYYLWRMIAPSGKLKWIEAMSIPRRQENGEVLWDGISMDATDRQLAQEQIRTTLHEKELLLKEIHHRVKNNLQIIISLLSLQSQYVQDERIDQLFQESQNRVYSMALIHEQLYQSTSLDRVNFADYANTLISHLQQSYFLRQSIELKVEIAEIFLSIETAVPCGLIINELVANSLKYAFPENQLDISSPVHPLITVEFKQIDDNKFSLLIGDNGVGISADIDLNNLNTLGLSLVQMLTQQLEGEITLHSQQGTECNIIFSELSYDQRI